MASARSLGLNERAIRVGILQLRFHRERVEFLLHLGTGRIFALSSWIFWTTALGVGEKIFAASQESLCKFGLLATMLAWQRWHSTRKESP